MQSTNIQNKKSMENVRSSHMNNIQMELNEHTFSDENERHQGDYGKTSQGIDANSDQCSQCHRE